ncbi:hypothetical protein CYMTET_51287 [Cymbomonas tetramitiformis]|uniref:Uncharacterized protein n=1 Tax=Cymbomonas tetramitiformis TaxID=36881 RepID=A0AAE0BMK9_9CHLO|nr:hypothetical protein CYMTET_51287 [Cymbomonas tetramitiformis]
MHLVCLAGQRRVTQPEAARRVLRLMASQEQSCVRTLLEPRENPQKHFSVWVTHHDTTLFFEYNISSVMETPRFLTSVSSLPQASWANLRTVLKPSAPRPLKKYAAAVPVSRVLFQRHLQCSSRQGEGGLHFATAAAVLPACVAAASLLGSPALASSETFAADIGLRESQIRSTPVGGYPTELSADDSQGGMRAPGLTSASGLQNKLRLLRPLHPVRDGIQWAIIIAVVVQIQLAKRRSRERSQALAEKLGYAADSTQDLLGSKWQIEMDIGREKGTWMPPGWAASGRRVVLPIAIELQGERTRS